MNAPIPANESDRLAALYRYRILDTPAEESFDDLTLLAAHICRVPTAMVSLVDAERQWFKSRVGKVEAVETPRDISFCGHVILDGGQVLQIPDARQDARFAANPLVTGQPYIRFYAGTPLVTPDGYAIGSLCVLSDQPHELTPEELRALAALGRRVVAQLELRRHVEQQAESQRKAEQMLVLADQSRRVLLSVLEDETEAGRRLRESEARFRQVVENIQEVFWLSDRRGERITYVSPAFATVWGRSCESVYQTANLWQDSIHPADRARVLRAAEARQVTGTYDETYRITRPDGTERWVRDRAFPVRNETGEEVGVAGVAEDISEKRTLEEAFLRAQRIEAVGSLANGVAHDLNNILSPVLMAAGLLRECRITQEERQLIDMIEQAARRGADIIRQLLTFSRGVEGVRIPVMLRNLLMEMLVLMKETFPRDIRIEGDIATDFPVVVGDTTQLHQVLMNLCVNARDAMPTGGRLKLKAGPTELTQEEADRHPNAAPGSYVRLEIEDDGMGIAPEVRTKMFEPFFTTKETGKGTGLGLSTVLGIVRSHQGFIGVESEPGRGSRFSVYLPVEREERAQEAQPTTRAAAWGSNRLILIVDDEESIRDTLKILLERQGYRVALARDGAEGLAFIEERAGELSLVVTDMMMPFLGGTEMIRLLRVRHPQLPVLVISGQTDEGARAVLAELGLARILAKPFVAEQLLQAIDETLGAGH